MMNLNLNLQERERTSYIGGSEVAAVLGFPDAFNTQFDVWARRQPDFVEEVDPSKSDLFEAGHRFEETVARWAGDIFGATETVMGDTYDGPVVVGPEDFAAVHPDAYMLIDGVWNVYEGKLAGRSWFKFGKKGQMPPRYLVQWVWEQMCCEMPGVFGAQLSLDKRPWTHRMDRDLEMEQELLNRVGEWWHRHVVKGEMPALDGSKAAADFVARRYKEHTDKIRVAVPAEIEKVKALAALRAQQADITKAVKKLEVEVKALVGGDAGLLLSDDDKPIRVTWKAQNAALRFDSKAFKKDHPELAEKYMKRGKPVRVLRPSPSWAAINK